MIKKKIVIFLYNRLFDPVVQSNLWLYIDYNLVNRKGYYKFHVLSYEVGEIPLTELQREKFGFWEQSGLSWTKSKWHKGKNIFLKAFDLLNGILSLVCLRISGYNYIISYGTISGSMAYIFSVILGFKIMIHTYEPHSEYMLDNMIWKKNSIHFKILHFLESRLAYKAKVIISATRFMEERLKNDMKVSASFYKIPSVVNENKFIFNMGDRKIIRSKYGIPESAFVVFYPGKFGGLYYKNEIAFIHKILMELDTRFHLLIVTPQTDEEVISIFDSQSIDRSSYTVTHADYENIHMFASASDIGLIAVPPGPSKKFISNIKVGEYLCSGLPFIITRGVSEDYLVAIESRVGVVVDDFDKNSFISAYPEIIGFLNIDPNLRRQHCRAVGVRFRGFETLNPRFSQALAEFVA